VQFRQIFRERKSQADEATIAARRAAESSSGSDIRVLWALRLRSHLVEAELRRCVTAEQTAA